LPIFVEQFFKNRIGRILRYLFSSNGYALAAVWSLLWQQTTSLT